MFRGATRPSISSSSLPALGEGRRERTILLVPARPQSAGRSRAGPAARREVEDRGDRLRGRRRRPPVRCAARTTRLATRRHGRGARRPKLHAGRGPVDEHVGRRRRPAGAARRRPAQQCRPCARGRARTSRPTARSSAGMHLEPDGVAQEAGVEVRRIAPRPQAERPAERLDLGRGVVEQRPDHRPSTGAMPASAPSAATRAAARISTVSAWSSSVWPSRSARRRPRGTTSAAPRIAPSCAHASTDSPARAPTPATTRWNGMPRRSLARRTYVASAPESGRGAGGRRGRPRAGPCSSRRRRTQGRTTGTPSRGRRRRQRAPSPGRNISCAPSGRRRPAAGRERRPAGGARPSSRRRPSRPTARGSATSSRVGRFSGPSQTRLNPSMPARSTHLRTKYSPASYCAHLRLEPDRALERPLDAAGAGAAPAASDASAARSATRPSATLVHHERRVALEERHHRLHPIEDLSLLRAS